MMTAHSLSSENQREQSIESSRDAFAGKLSSIATKGPIRESEFEAADSNDDGTLNIVEFANMMRQHEGGRDLTDKQIKAQFVQLDKNKDGKVCNSPSLPTCHLSSPISLISCPRAPVAGQYR